MGKTDFAHYAITLATNLASTTPVSTFVGNEKRNNLAGWLGDATIGRPVAFGNDDYKADLDAANIAHMMKHNKMSYPEASNRYYSDLMDGRYTRADKFKEHTPIDKVKSEIVSELQPRHIDEPRSRDGVEIMTKERIDDKLSELAEDSNFSEAIRFIESLQQGTNDLI
jgi:hypothetical protein